jgi:protein phosphatase PTC7
MFVNRILCGRVLLALSSTFYIPTQQQKPRFLSGYAMIPHPAKIARGGEDACFTNPISLGIFDGISAWWYEDHIDAGEFAQSLSIFTQESINVCSPMTAIEDALQKTKLTGSATACVVKLNECGDTIDTFNMGDSGFILFRKIREYWVIIAASTPKMHSENTPFQLGSFEAPTTDAPDIADKMKISAQIGDIVILGTDGLFDNLTHKEILQLVNGFQINNNSKPKKLAWLLASQARDKWEKIDDITVVVAEIQLK